MMGLLGYSFMGHKEILFRIIFLFSFSSLFYITPLAYVINKKINIIFLKFTELYIYQFLFYFIIYMLSGNILKHTSILYIAGCLGIMSPY
jgi:hypothetical protein